MSPARKTVLSALLATSSLLAPSIAHATTPAPKFTSIDANNVDLSTGLVWYSMEEGGIGSGPGRVAMQRIFAEGAGWADNWSGGLYPVTSGGVTKMYVQFAGISDTFSGSGTSWTSDKADGSTLTVDAQGKWNYTGRDGTKAQFDTIKADMAGEVNFTKNCPGADPSACQVPLSITQPNGLKFTLSWAYTHLCQDLPGEPCAIIHSYQRLSAISSSAGYSAVISYLSSSIGSWPNPNLNWFIRTGVGFGNVAGQPSPAPTITYSYGTNTVTVTDPASRAWVFTTDSSGRLTGIKRPGSVSNNYSYIYGTGGTITSATKDGVTDTYAISTGLGLTTATVTDPLSHQIVVNTDLSVGRPISYKDELNRSTVYAYDTNGRLSQLTAPEGNYTHYFYDARGNVTATVEAPKSGSGLANINTSASFDSTCTNPVKCNQPNSSTDGKGFTTDYTYDPTHGGVLTITQPAPATGAVRPQTRVTYTQVTGASGELVYMPTKIAACQTLSSCTNGADESQVITGYNSNLQPTTITRQNGTGTLTATSTMTYDPRGNALTVDGPLSGTADTWAYKYDAADQRVGAISPDPDGASGLHNRAIRLTYRPDGQVSKQEIGTTVGQTDANWTAFAPLQTIDIAYDANSRPISTKLSASGTDYSLTQASYDALGRTDCTTVRMNTAIYGSLPAACTLGTQGSFGPDRISQTVYDAASEVTQNKVAVGTTDAATERTLTYTNNGKLATLKDGENNLTTFEYDGFDRLLKTRYPSPTKGSGTSSTTDYEQLTYDFNSNVTLRRLRDTGNVNLVYDNLNRLITLAPPNPEATRQYTYDNLGRMLTANKAGSTLTFTYDALSRNLTQVSPQGTLTSAWDAAGRRTQLTYPGTGLYLNYDYLVTGETTKVRENSASTGIGVLATYGYDPLTNAGQLGQVTSLSLGNGAIETYGYDAVSRLTSLGIDASGTTNDLAKTFAYNPASQIASETRSNTAYSQVLANTTQTSGTNGLNELATVNGTSAAYDARGNMTTDPATAKSYTYISSNNQLLNVSTPFTSFTYDALDRLWDVETPTVTKYVSDGADKIAEYDGSNAVQKRYAFDGSGQPLVQYDAAGARTWMLSDERGSVVALANDSAVINTINTYDEYGIPAAANAGTFQFAGMHWLSRPALHAPTFRAYAQHLGRFNQTDPLGQATDGPNLYAYVRNDPINLNDPLGLSAGTGCLSTMEGSDIIVNHCVDDLVASITGVENITDLVGDLHKIYDKIQKSFEDRGQKLPPCAVNFLKSKISINPSSITFHEGGSLINATGNSVTYGSDIYLRTGADMWNKFHEIAHVNQNAKMGLNSFDHFAAYLGFGGHDASPLEQAADTFATNTLAAYKAAGLDKTCPF